MEFRMLADNSPDLITRYNRDLTYSYANQTVELLTGIPVAKIIGRNNLDIGLEPELASFIEEMHLEVFRTGRKLKFEFRLQKDNEFKVFQAHMVPELSKEGAVDSVLNVSRDITQIKSVEKALKEEKQNIIDENQLIAKNLKSWCYQLCTNPQHGEVAAQCLGPIMRIAEWAQSGYNQQNISPKPINLNQLLSAYHAEKMKKVNSDKVELVLNLPPNQITVFSDSNILVNTIDYLIENAIEATLEGKIELGFDVYNENEIVIFVKDTGMGIEAELTEQIFEPFYFFNKEGHAGLGLSIARKNVKNFTGSDLVPVGGWYRFNLLLYPSGPG
jgi:PAS domain S-box-containing protein